MADKIYTLLPVVNQTTAVKNFFESTVEQLFAEANSEIISGFIGRKTSDDHNVNLAFLDEPTIDRKFYSLSPVVNTINLTSGESEGFIFFDEYINTLNIYGANTLNQNKIFSSDFKTFLPPVNVDKLINFQEYYWDPETSANCHTIVDWTANTSFTTNTVIKNSGSYYIANRNFTSGSTFVNDTSLDTYTFTADIIQSTNATITTNLDHNFYTGDKVKITGVSGMTEVNNQTYYVESITSRTLKLYTDKDLRIPLDTTGFTAWTSGGTITHESGPTAISISGNVSNYIDIERDIIGKTSFTPAGGKAFRNGMVVTFTGNYVLSSTITNDIDYIVEGVGTAIRLVNRNVSRSAPYSYTTGKDYIHLERGSTNNNIWSRNNFWFHKENYLDATDRVPDKGKRSLRPILEYDADLELYNHGITYKGNVDLSISELTFEQANALTEGQSIDGITIDANVSPAYRCIFPNEIESISKQIFTLNVSGGEVSFTSAETLQTGDVVNVHRGTTNIGSEYYVGTTGLDLAQSKPNRSTAPLFNLYKDDKTYLGDNTLYPLNNFTGNKLFSHKEATGTNDLEYGFPLSYKAFKSSSEIEYENYATTAVYKYTAVGSTTETTQTGYYYYKLLKATDEYHTLFKNSDKKHKQRIETYFELTNADVDASKLVYFCGGIPDIDINNHSGYDILVKVNSVKNTDFTYHGDGFIKFNSFTFVKGTLIDISIKSDTGLISENSISKHNLPLSWRGNPDNTEISTTSEPEYLHHFSNYMSEQQGFTGNVLSVNNFTELSKQSSYATDIVQTTQDTMLGVFLLDDQPHNLVDSLRFNASEYSRYKKRFLKELENYYNNFDVSELTNEFILEKVLRNVISFSVGRTVFNSTYLLPFGDNYSEETISVTDTSVTDYTPTNYLDLDKIENSMLVYKNRGTTRTLLCVDKDYTISNYNPITITISNLSDFNTGDILLFRFYDSERDSAQCPPTPSAMGLYPLFQPALEVDKSFQTETTVILGHDGSRTSLIGDRRDDIILEFENRIYNSAKAEFRTNNSVGHYSAINVRPGHFRTNEYGIEDWQDLLNLNYYNWVQENSLDPVANDFYDLTNEFTWNYRGSSNIPGHWRGWYEYYYDTVRPHTHPWEMLGFTEKPTWWDTTYITAVYTDYSSANTPMWDDIEQGKIVSGTRENVTSGLYKNTDFNPYRRIGLSAVLPVSSTATLISPYDIVSTGSTTLTPTWSNSTPDTTQGYVTTSFRSLDGINVNYDSTNVYVLSNNIVNHNVTISDTSNVSYINAKSQALKYDIPRRDLLNLTVATNQPQLSYAIAVLNNGLPIYNIKDVNTYNGNTSYNYNLVESQSSAFALGNTSNTGIQYYHTINAEVVGETAWGNATTHSGIVGWAFDGFPIYGPYGYKGLAANGEITDNTITNIKSCFQLKTGLRDSSVGGAHTGEFVQDYEYSSGLASSDGTVGNNGLGKYNLRYGKTPESPSSAIHYYVCTQDDTGQPMFPYHVGGGTDVGTTTYQNKYYGTPYLTNNLSQGLFDSTATVALLSTFSNLQTNTGTMNAQWRFGDGAPVENAWKYSVEYPFAIVEALLLAKPGLFATMYSDPTKITTPKVDSRSFISTATRKKWLFKDSADFEIHGDVDTTTGNTITNIGYTQFINSWLNFQGLNASDSFAEKLRTLNIKLGHRMAGFVDKDTMRLTLDQYSSTGSSTNLILPADNITVAIHDSAYKTRNFYSGVIIEKSTLGWKVKGYDKKAGYFDTLQLDTTGTTESVSVGGETISHSTWAANVAYPTNSYVIHNGGYYKATTDAPASATFVSSYWQTLNSLPQEQSATATYYQQTTNIIERVYYNTEYTDAQSLFNFLNALGKYQDRAGYDLGSYDTAISATRDWLYGAKQFLFWTTGSWQVGNTLELSPLASKLKFTPPTGFVAKVNRSERDMFSIMDQTGKAIEPTECDILREGTDIEIVPPAGKEIYGLVLYTKEIEHAIVIDNITDFADTIFDPVLNQRQNRIKLKATRTTNWDGKLSTQGFMVDGGELIPNLDNLATTMGKYSEMGFVPVERDVYEASRRLYGYQERTYLNELDITDDQQFDFYRGMIQGKGTSTSLSRIARSSNILQGDMNVYDEWAIKVGDFGDVTNNQSVELKINRANVVQDPQLISLAFPQDTTGTISSIELIKAKHKYFSVPTITINSPTTGTNVATATATLNSSGELSKLTITNPGTGYTTGTGLVIETANISTNDTSQLFTKTDAMSSAYVTFKEYDYYNNSLLVNENSNITGLGSLTVTDHFGGASTYNLSNITDIANISTFINTDATINANITASIITQNAVSNTTVNANVVTWHANTQYQANSLIRYEATTLAGGFESGKKYVIKTLGNTDFTAIGGIQVDAGNIVGNTSYIINSTGTSDFTSVGATNSNVGTIFIANASFLANANVTGNGTVIETLFTANAIGTGTGTASNTEILTATLDQDYRDLFTPSTNASFTTGATFNSNLYFTTVIGSLNVGQQYVIDTPNNTDFTKLGATANTAGTIFTATSTGNISAGNFVTGSVYVISTTQANANAIATDFTTIGATNNTPGTVFTATNIGTGTGTAFLGSGLVHQGKGNLEVKSGAFVTSGGYTIPVYRDVNYLKIQGNDFTLSDNDSNVTLGKLHLGNSSTRYQPRQRYKVLTANNTVGTNYVENTANNELKTGNITVTIGNTTYSPNKIVDSSANSQLTGHSDTIAIFDLGGRWQIKPRGPVTGTANVEYHLESFISGNSSNQAEGEVTQILPDDGTSKTSFGNVTASDFTNITTISNNDYLFVDVYIDGELIENEGDISYYTLTNNTITFNNASLLPKKELTEASNVYIIEHSTIDFKDVFKDDLPGSTLNIKATTNDDLVAKITPVRNYEISPDASDDEVILIDIDDTSRFLKKPSGLRTDELWKTTSNVSSIGITDSKFNPLPNAGYVNKNNVTYQAFSIPSIAQLFGDNILFKPSANDTIHVAKAENQDWNVYSLADANSTLAFVEQDDTDETAYLYLNDTDLFSYVDDNAIGGTDNSRYLDYHLVIKDADLSDQFVVWTNQEIVSKKGVKISNFAGAKMTTANITSIEPREVLGISNITPAVTDSAIATANTTASAGTIQISTSVYNLENGDVVGFQESDPTQLTFTTSSVEQLKVESTHSVTNGSGDYTITITANASLEFANIFNSSNADITLADFEALQYVDVAATNIVSGTEYIILDTGSSDFTTAGSTDNANGTIFTANVSGTSGTGIVSATTGTNYINETSIIIPESKRPSSTGNFTLTQVHNEKLKLSVANIHVNGTDVVTPGRTIDLVASNTSWDGQTFTVNEVGSHYITISSDDFPEVASGNVNLIDLSTIGITGFKYNQVSNIHAKEYTVSNISSSGFTIYDANVTSNIAHTSLSISYFGKTMITTDNYKILNGTANTSVVSDHNLAAGDIVKLIANSYSGYYFVENATENTFVIDMPYNATVSKTGSVIKPGININTDNPHGIDSAYAGKRIAVHMADPDYYNQVYIVNSVTSNTISVADAFSYADVANAQITSWSAGLSIVEGKRYKNGDVVYVANTSFTAGSEFSSSNLNIGRPAVVTTIDHNKIKLNNTDIVLNDIKSEDDIVDSINNAMKLRRGAIDTDGTISFVMLNGSNDHLVKPILGDYRKIAGYSPYVTADDIDNSRLTDGMSRAGTITFKTNRKGFVNDPLSPLLPENKTPLSKLNTDASNPAYLGDTNNYGGNASQLEVPVFNINDPTVSPLPGTGIDSGAKPILDPKKALASINKKPCVDMCSPIHQPPTPVVPIQSPPQITTICYGGSLVNASGQPGIFSINGTSHGKRTFGGQWAGYYVLTGSHAGFVTQTGGSRAGLRGSALAGVMIWSDNGSTKNFNMRLKFTKAGTYYAHVFNAGRSGYNDRTYVDINNITNGTTNLGRQNSVFSGKSFSFRNGGVKAFTVVADDIIEFKGVCRGGGNHWHGLCMHISTSATGLDSCAKSQLPATSTTTGYANIPQKQSATSNAVISYHEQHNRSARQTDRDYYVLSNSGTVEICFDFYSGADGMTIYQGTSKTGLGKQVASTGTTTVQKLTDPEKNQILTKNGGQTQNSKPRFGSGGVIKDFILAPNSAGGTGVKYGGKISFNVDISNGTYLTVETNKPSIVYRYVIKLPNKPVKPLDPKQNPVPGQTCGLPIYSPTAPTVNTGVQSPIYTPTGSPTTKKKIPNHGAGRGTGGGGGGGGGGYSNKGIYDPYRSLYQASVKGVSPHDSGHYYSHNYGGFGLAPMAGFSMVPDIFKKTIKVTSSNSYGAYQPLTTSQYVNNTVQRVTGNQILPLAQPLRHVRPSRPGSLRALDLSNYPFWNELSYTGDGWYKKGNNFFTYTPGKIGTDIRLQDGTFIGNVLDDFNISDGISGLDILLNYPGQIPNVLPNPNQSQIDLAANITIPAEDSPTESNVIFNASPVIGIQPKIKDKLGNYVPAGPMVYCSLDKPMPGHTIGFDEMTGIKPGDELIINSTKIRFPGSDPVSVEKSLRCTQGSGYMVHDTFKDGKPALRISSCSNAPLTIRDGCAGGVYKEVLDFHVVRGFDQSVTETSNTAVLPATTGYSHGGDSGGATAVNPSATYTMYSVAGTSTGTFSGSGGTPSTTTGAILSSKSSNKSTGGSGYAIGDRLRLVGGIPIANPYGGVTELCIDMPGADFSSPENVKVYIGDGSTPGSGAKAGAVTLNENGGIVNIEIIQGGEGYDFSNPPKVRVIDIGQSLQTNTMSASISAKVGTGEGLPPRVGKFIVSSVDSNGTITSLQIIDRGIYKQFPADLSLGVPLEYDGVGLGDETGVDAAGQYYQGTGLGQFDPLNDNERLSSPGAYDPINSKIGGGTGARVFLTAREIPDCSERGDAKSKLGLPDSIFDINIPEDISACLNTALSDAGYDPDKIHVDVGNLNDLVDLLKIRAPGYDGLTIDELTPGFLEKLGIPPGDYNIDSLCIDAVLETPNSEVRRANKIQSGTNLLDDNKFQIATLPDSPTLALNCVDTIGNGWNQDGSRNTGVGVNGQDPNSILGDGTALFHTDMFQYELRTISGEPVTTLKRQQECKVLYLESVRYPSNTGNVVVKGSANLDLNTFSNVWVDNYNNNGWAYFEGSNVASITQPKLVDTTFVDNAILYDQETGEKEYDLHFYDPFKGVIPGFIDKEIAFKGQQDPVVYNNARSGFGRKDIGKVWWDTSTIAYNWYEQTDSNRERWLNWGSTFPGSGITLYEWVEDTSPPTGYAGTGIPKNTSQFVVERRFNRVSQRYVNYYYFWVQNKTTLENIAVEELGRQYDTFTLAKYLADPLGSGLPLISFVSDKAMVVSNIAPLLREDEQNLQINFSRNLNPVGQSHTAWKLLRQNDNNSIIPDDLSNKLIDSLCGNDATGQTVPDPLLSEVEAYGIKFRPRQSMFKNVKDARQVLHYTLNEILADLQLSTNYPDWDSTLPVSRTYIETVNWFGTQYTDATTNAKVRYNNSFKPIYKVNSVAELDTLKNIPDNTIVQVKGPNATEYSLHKYIAGTKTFELISIQNDNVKLKTTVYTDSTNSTLSNELRLLLVALKDKVFAGTNLWNKLFFALMKYAYSEQKQLDWAFKTSYIYIEKEEQDLIEINGLKVDNFDKVLQYFDEVKPYTAKIREYKDGKSPVRETIGVNAVSDFDKPPYADPVTGNVRILDDFLQADSNIIQTNNAYTKYYSIANKSSDPIRKSNTTILFDRVDYKLLPHDYQPAVNVATWTANATYPRGSYVVAGGNYYKANTDISGSATFNISNWTNLGSSKGVVPIADTSNSAIARNIVTLHTQSNTEIQANTLIRASERAFKFNPAIQTQFAAELNTYYSITDAVSNANVINSSNITGSIANITTIVNSGGLDKTLALVKTAAGGDFLGSLLDANLFSQTYGVDSDILQAKIGFNTRGWQSDNFDIGLKVENYRGVFNTQITGNEINFERDGVLYDGFDGVTFKRVAYGEERPQELIHVEPLETIIFRVTTNANPVYSNGTVIANNSTYNPPVYYTDSTVNRFGTNVILDGNDIDVTGTRHLSNVLTEANATTVFTGTVTYTSSNASTVKHQMTNNIYGDTEFLRIKQDGTTTTTTTANVYINSDNISVANASVLTKPLNRIPGILWLGTERIEYTVRNTTTNKISGLSRGTNGTSIQNWTTGTEVINGGKSELFTSYPVTANVWLNTIVNTTANGAVSNSNTIIVDNGQGIKSNMTIKVEGVLQNGVVISTSSNTVTVSENITISNNANITFTLGATSLADLGNADISSSTSIMRFLHNRE